MLSNIIHLLLATAENPITELFLQAASQINIQLSLQPSSLFAASRESFHVKISHYK